jgi:hypothetical protein
MIVAPANSSQTTRVHQHVCGNINAARHLIQNYDPILPQNSSCKAKELPLAM